MIYRNPTLNLAHAAMVATPFLARFSVDSAAPSLPSPTRIQLRTADDLSSWLCTNSSLDTLARITEPTLVKEFRERDFLTVPFKARLVRRSFLKFRAGFRAEYGSLTDLLLLKRS